MIQDGLNKEEAGIGQPDKRSPSVLAILRKFVEKTNHQFNQLIARLLVIHNVPYFHLRPGSQFRSSISSGRATPYQIKQVAAIRTKSTFIPAKSATKPNTIRTVVQPRDFLDCALMFNSLHIVLHCVFS